MEKMSYPILSKSWNEARQKLTEALSLVRGVLETASCELSESEERLNRTLASVDGTFEKLGINAADNRGDA